MRKLCMQRSCCLCGSGLRKKAGILEKNNEESKKDFLAKKDSFQEYWYNSAEHYDLLPDNKKAAQ